MTFGRYFVCGYLDLQGHIHGPQGEYPYPNCGVRLRGPRSYLFRTYLKLQEDMAATILIQWIVAMGALLTSFKDCRIGFSSRLDHA